MGWIDAEVGIGRPKRRFMDAMRENTITKDDETVMQCLIQCHHCHVGMGEKSIFNQNPIFH